MSERVARHEYERSRFSDSGNCWCGWDADAAIHVPLYADTQCAPHAFERLGWRWWLCRHCFAPKSLHPRRGWFRARPLGNREYLSANAPHFKEGW